MLLSFAGALSAAVQAAHSNDSRTPTLVLQLGHSSYPATLAFHPKGRWIATGSRDGTVKIWEVATGYLVRTLRAPDPGGVMDVSFSSDGRLLAACTVNAGIVVWDTTTTEEVFSLKPSHPDQGCSLAFAPHAQRLAVALEYTHLTVLDTTDWKEIWKAELGYAVITSLAFRPDSQTLAVASFDDLSILEAETGKRLFQFPEPPDATEGWADTAMFSPDGRILAVVPLSSRNIALYSADTKALLGELKAPAVLRSAQFSSDSRCLVSTTIDNVLLMWDLTTLAATQTIPVGSYAAVAGFTPDDRWIVVAGDGIGVWERSSGKPVRRLGTEAAPVESADVSTDGRELVMGGWLAVKLMETSSSHLNMLAPAPTHALAMSADGAWLASGSGRFEKPEISLWHSGKKDPQHPSLVGHTDMVNALAFSPDGKWLISGSEDETIRVWDVSTGQTIKILKEHTSAVLAIATAPGMAVSASADGTVKVWDIPSGGLRMTLTGHTDEVRAVAVTADGRYAASGGKDGVLKRWDLKTGKELWSVPAHIGSINAVAIGDDGTIATAGNDHGVRIWSPADGSQAADLEGHTDEVHALSFVSNLPLLVSGSDDGSARLWDLSTKKEAGLLTARKDSADWVLVTPDGLFDGSEQGIRGLVAWRINARMYPPDKFFADYYTPGLLAKIFAGEHPKPKVDIASLKLPPDVRITAPGAETVRDEHAVVKVEIQDQGGGISDVRLYQNGKLVGVREESRAAGAASVKYSFEIELVAGENILRAVALSHEKVEGSDDSVRVVLNAPPVTKPVLHVLVVGINQYEDSSFNLNYARQDGEAIASFFAEHGQKLFASVDQISLFDQQATQARIRAALEKLAQDAKPEDVLLVYLAGHGVGLEQQFYFLPHEMHVQDDDEAAVRQFGISATALGEYLRRIPALKQLLILDACQSEAALPILAKMVSFRGLGSPERKATQMLARANGVYLIAASTKQQYAVEVPELHHGVLTYVLLSGLGETGQPEAPVSAEGMITVLSLLQYVNQKVPEITDLYEHQKQYPVSFSTGMDFPLWVR